MSLTVVKGAAIGAVLLTAGGAIAGYSFMNEPAAPEFAQVLSATPVTEQIAKEREVCEDVPVTEQKAPRDKHQVAGTVSGALIGGVLGNQVGGGNGKKLATVAGAAIGGIAGNKLQKRAQANDVVTSIEQRCTMVTDYSDRIIGYDVVYQIGAEQGEVRMDEKPGERITLIDGELPLAMR